MRSLTTYHRALRVLALGISGTHVSCKACGNLKYVIIQFPFALRLRYTMQAIIDFAMEVDPTTEIALTVLARPISLAGTEVLFDDFEGLEWGL